MSVPITPLPQSYQTLATVTGGIPALRPQANGAPEGGNIVSKYLSPQDLQHGKAYITAADLIAGNTTPISLIKAPGYTISNQSNPQDEAGGTSNAFKWFGATTTPTIILLGAFFRFIWPASGGVAFTSGGAMSFVYHGTSTTNMNTVAAAVVTATASAGIWVEPLSAATGTDLTAGLGLGIDLSVAGSNFATGNSQVAIDLWWIQV
jgi:hypothetical protein